MIAEDSEYDTCNTPNDKIRTENLGFLLEENPPDIVKKFA
jgi:hypothetical protein